ncbi:hypothetical protein RQN30_11650 [Arcanobacterium hippocoleae]
MNSDANSVSPVKNTDGPGTDDIYTVSLPVGTHEKQHRRLPA